MDGLCRVTASPVPWEAGPETLLVRPLTLRDLGTLEQLLLSRRPDPFDRLRRLMAVCGRIADHVKDLFGQEAEAVRKDRGRRVIKRTALQDWLDTPDGCDWSAWLCVYAGDRPRFPGVAEARHFFRQGGRDLSRRFRRLRDMASGLDILSNLDWPDVGEPDGPVRFLPWKRIARFLADGYGWDAERMGGLTLWNLAVYTCEDELLGGVKSVSVADARRLAPEAFNRQQQRHLAQAFREGGE